MQFSRRVVYLGVACLALATHSLSKAAVVTGPIVNPGNGNSYYLLAGTDWSASEAEAVGLGGHLATVNDATENNWIQATFSNYGSVSRDLWIGLNDLATEGVFQWVSGDPYSYSNWAPSEPNNFNGLEDATLLVPTGQWNDFDATATDRGFGVVEVRVPEPSTLVLLSGAAMGLFSRRRFIV
jgi:hypothetical protein